jgi:hypothetical protein
VTVQTQVVGSKNDKIKIMNHKQGYGKRLSLLTKVVENLKGTHKRLEKRSRLDAKFEETAERN